MFLTWREGLASGLGVIGMDQRRWRVGELSEVMSRQIAAVDQRVVAQQQLRSRLVAVRQAVSEGAQPDIDQLLDAMEAIMNDPGFTAEQKATFTQRHGPRGEALAEWQRRGSEIDVEARRLAAAGTDPAADTAQGLGRRWAELFEDMAGGDRAVLSSLYARLDRMGPEQATQGAISAETWDFVRRVLVVGFGTPAADH